MRGQKAVVWFEEVTKKDIPLVGGKGANLGEMTNAGIPVPPGFIVTADAYFDFIEKSGLSDKIKSLLEPLDVHDSKQLQEIAAKVQELIKKTGFELVKQFKNPMFHWSWIEEGTVLNYRKKKII